MASIQLKFGTLALDSTNNITVSDLAEKCAKPVKTVNIPKTDGAIAETVKLGPKTITLKGDIAGTSYDNLRTNIDALRAGFLNGLQKLTKDDERYIYCQLKTLSFKYDHLTVRATWTAQLIAHFPFWLSETLNTDTRIPASGTGYTIANAGNAPTRAKVQVTAPNPDLLSQFDGADAAVAYTAETAQVFTFGGTAQLDTAQFKLGTASLLLDGNSDYVTLPDNATWNFGTGNLSILSRLRFAGIAAEQVIAGQYEDANNYWFLKITAANKLQLKFVDGGVTKGDYIMTSAWAGLAIDTWYHILAIRNGTTALIFIDGVSQTLTETTAFSTNDVGDMVAVLDIGYQNSAAYFNGWIDEIEIYKGSAIYTAAFTVPTAQTEVDITDNMQIENTTRSELCKYRGTVSAGNVLIVDNRVASDDFVVTNNAVDDFENFEGDFINLSAGNNTIELTGTMGETVVSWRDAWY